MPRKQTTFPQWWLDLDISARLREQIRASYSITPDGYARWYKGAPRKVAKSVPPAEVEDAWKAKCKAVDAAPSGGSVSVGPNAYRTYRVALSEFLAVQKARVGAARRALSDRSYHNYAEALNAFGRFPWAGQTVADLPLAGIGPEVFSAYARTFGDWKASAFDSVVSRVGALFRWAEGQEYIDRYRPGPEFRRPAKGEIRDQRIDLSKSYAVDEIARLYNAANATMRCWVALGTCAAFNNSDIAHLPRECVDLPAGVIDFRRRKSGKVRRVIPLPADVADLLRAYVRPEPAGAAHGGLFFLTEGGLPYARSGRSRSGRWMPSDSVSRMFRELEKAAEVPHRKGRNFSGLRTGFSGLAPPGYTEEVEVILGHAKGSILLDHYSEHVRMERLRFVTEFVWAQVRAVISPS